MSNSTATNLRDYREAAGLTQVAFAELAGLTDTTVSDLEAGKRRPTPQTAGKIVEALNKKMGTALHTWDVFPARFKNLDAEVKAA